jgi:bilirubin oxidase
MEEKMVRNLPSIKYGMGLLVILLSTVTGLAWAGETMWRTTRSFEPLPAAPEFVPSVDGSQMSLAEAGTTVNYVHTITNDGMGPITFNLSTSSNQGWSTSVSPTSITIPGNQSAQITVTVPVTAGVPSGMTHLVTLTASPVPAGPPPLVVRDTLLVQGTTELAIPPAQYGTLVNGQRTYQLTADESTHEFWPGVDTPTYGYNGSFLGPTLIMTHTETVSITVTNNLAEETTTHWHGLHLPAVMDGGPHQPILPGESWYPTFPMHHEATTFWYHPHPHAAHHAREAVTGAQVQMGLAGMIIVRDEASNALGLPQTYGVDEFPLVLQDRGFNEDGSFEEFPTPNWGLRKGDQFLVNGTLGGNLDVPAQMVRFHVLNGSDSRFMYLGFEDNRPFYQIASDGGLLNAPVERTRLLLASGERAEIVVDLSGESGSSVNFVAFNENVAEEFIVPPTADGFDMANFIFFTLHVVDPTPNPVTTLPTVTNDIVRIEADQAMMTRTVLLTVGPLIDFTAFDMEVINITTTVDTMEVWSIVNISEEAHPLHIHDDQFQIISRNGAPPEAHEMGWKDTVIVRPGERVDVIKIFVDYADNENPFMYHCHLLGHEDEGMMGQYLTVESHKAYLPLILR